MEFHPVADLFPMMSDDERADLERDVCENGLREPIWTHDGKIVDGRNRYLACKAVGVTPRFREWSGEGSLVAFVWSLNATRRHLTQSQKAVVALAVLPMLEEEARERKLATLKQGDAAPVPAQMPERESGESREKAAELVGVSPRYVSEAKRIEKEAPELLDAIRSGSKTITQARREITTKAREERKRPAEVWDTTKLVLHHGDMGDVDAGVVDCIITDPPYPGEHLESWDALGAFAARHLRDGGSMLAMSGQFHLPEVIARLSAHGLRYHWTLAYLTPGGQAVQVWPRKVNTFWKPVIWFTKGEYDGPWVGDVTRSNVNDNDKRFHHWGQSLSGMIDLVSRVTAPGDTVCDPCCGGGATLAAALHLGRSAIGVDVDATAIETCRSRFGLVAA